MVVNYTDLSTNNPTSWFWVFPGGSPSTSTQQNPTVTYNIPGRHDVTLEATNGAGTDVLVGGEGDDTFVFIVGDSNLETLDQIIDFSFNTAGADKLGLVNHGSEVISSSSLDVSSATNLSEAANLAASSDGSTNAIIKWFIYEDNTYVVQDLSADVTFQNTTDIIIELQGVSDLQGLNSSTILFS